MIPGAAGACFGAVSTGIALERTLEEVVAMADIALGMVAVTGTENGGGQVSKSTGLELPEGYICDRANSVAKLNTSKLWQVQDCVSEVIGWIKIF